MLKSVALIGIICLSLVGCSNTSNTTENSKDNEVYQEETSQQETEQQKEYSLVLESGMYKVGEDLPSGEYLLIKNKDEMMGSFNRTTDTTGEIGSTIDSNAFSNFEYIYVDEGEYLQIDKCTLVPKAEDDHNFMEDDTISDGMFEVGVDIAPGEYKLEPINEGGDCWFSLYNNLNGLQLSNGKIPDLVTADSFEGSRYITLKEGQFLKLDNQTCISK